MAKNNLVLVVVLALVVAVVASVATVSLTGDVVIRQGFGKKVTVTTNQEVLKMLSKCETDGGNLIGSTSLNDLVVGSNNLDTCNEICSLGSTTSICSQGFIGASDRDNIEAGFLVAPIGCERDFNYERSPQLIDIKAVVYCTCCSS